MIGFECRARAYIVARVDSYLLLIVVSYLSYDIQDDFYLQTDY